MGFACLNGFLPFSGYYYTTLLRRRKADKKQASTASTGEALCFLNFRYHFQKSICIFLIWNKLLNILFIFASYQQLGRLFNKTSIVLLKPDFVRFLMFSFAAELIDEVWERLSL